MKQIDWNRLVPLGISGKRVRNGLLLALAAGAVVSLGFLKRYSDAAEQLYEQVGWNRVLIDGAVMEDFAALLPGSFWGLGAVAICMVAVATGFYFYHYQGGRSIYTMRRLPNRWELWQRCLALPLLTAAACLVLAAVLTLLYFGFYILATPDACLTPGQWRKLWRG